MGASIRAALVGGFSPFRLQVALMPTWTLLPKEASACTRSPAPSSDNPVQVEAAEKQEVNVDVCASNITDRFGLPKDHSSLMDASDFIKTEERKMNHIQETSVE